MKKEKHAMSSALKRWYFFAVFWPVFCLVFAGIIMGQSGRTLDERISDTGFTLFPLVFFAIGMSIRRRLLKERGAATALVAATVVSEGRRKRTGRNKNYFPVFEFQANGILYKVTYLSGSGFQLVKEGEQVDLYYTPENPRVFYVPVLQRHDKRRSRLFCGIGILFPLVGLFAPQIREFFSFCPSLSVCQRIVFAKNSPLKNPLLQKNAGTDHFCSGVF